MIGGLGFFNLKNNIQSALGQSVLAAPSPPQTSLTNSKLDKAVPHNPEVTAILVNLLNRYANNVVDKTDSDIALEAILKDTPNSLQTARIIVENFQKIPIDVRRKFYGDLADVTTQKISMEKYVSFFEHMTAVQLNGLSNHDLKIKTYIDQRFTEENVSVQQRNYILIGQDRTSFIWTDGRESLLIV